MKNSWLIAMREWKARVGSRSFIVLSILGPLVILAMTYFMFKFGGEGKQQWNVLVTDKSGILESKVLPGDDKNITYSFANDYIEMDDFRDNPRYQEYDAMIEINELVLQNKVSHVFYRSAPSVRMQTAVQYQIERRIEQVLVDRDPNISMSGYLQIKQALTMGFADVYDPKNKATDLSAWVGFFYGALIFVFIFLFGMTILRSVSREKSNRIVEVLLASVSPKQLMSGKIIGIGLAAILQFVIWSVIIGLGLYFMRESLFPDMFDVSNMNVEDLKLKAEDQSFIQKHYASLEYNQFVELIYTRVNFSVMLPFFILFFIAGYLFYGALFAAVGATMGTESDGQQFVLPIIFLLCFSLYSGYHVMNYPESGLSGFFQFLPFTAPVAVMVKLAQGYEPGHVYEIYVSLFILLASAFVFLRIAARVYKNGILQFGHRVRLKHLLKWLRKS